MSQQILPGVERSNKVEAPRRRRGLISAEGQERPGSGKSDATRMTGGLTGAFTQFSGTRSTTTGIMARAAEKDLALKNLTNRKYKLVNFIKHDTTLGREQNIDLHKESSLANADKLLVKGGVKLTHFHPEKKKMLDTNIEDTGSSEEATFSPARSKEFGGKSEKTKTWEEKLAKRKRDEAVHETLIPANIINGGLYTIPNRMSRSDYA